MLNPAVFFCFSLHAKKDYIIYTNCCTSKDGRPMVNRWSTQWNTKSGLPVLDRKKNNLSPMCWVHVGEFPVDAAFADADADVVVQIISSSSWASLRYAS